MFNIFKKKYEEEKHELSEQIPVSNLESYVVQGYENEKRMKSEIERLKGKIEQYEKDKVEHSALKVVLQNKEREIDNLIAENKRIERLEEQLNESRKRFNNLKIREQSLLDERDKLEDAMREAITADVKNTVLAKINEHKGNLSKAIVTEIVEGVE